MNGHASRLESFGWGYAPIGTTGTVTLGKMLTPSQKAATDSKRPYLRAAHVQPGGRLDFSVPEKSMWFSESEVRKLDLVPNDIVIVEGGAVGRSAIIEKQLEGWGFQNSIVRIRPNPEVAHAPYIRYALQFGYDSKMIELECSTATLPHFTAEKVSRFRIPLPDLPTQRRIADYLDRETSQIDAMAGALDGLVARLEERRSAVITRVTSGLPAEATDFDTFNSPTDGTPRAWTRTRFGHEFIESTERVGSQTPGPLLSISEYRGIEVNTRTDGQMPSLDVSNYRVVRPGQLAANMMWLNHGGIGVSNHLGYISPDYKSFFISPRVNTRFAHYLFRTSRYITYFETIGTGVRPNAKRVTKTALNATPLSLPPLDEQRRIADYLDAETAKIDAMIAKAGELRALLDERRSALITATVTGQHPVPKEP